MSGVPAGHRAVGLAWLCPSADALLALTASPPDSPVIARDPAALAHVLRYARPTPDPDRFALTPALLNQPSLCATAAALLDAAADPFALVPAHPALIPLDRLAELAAATAAELSARHELASPDAAAAAARLALLGWYAVGAVDPAAVEACLTDPDHASDPVAVQRRRWGLSAAAVVRRLAARWRLPPWLTATVGFLRLPADDAARLGAPAGLFRIVQTATTAAERLLGPLGLTDPRITVSGDPLAVEAAAIAEAVLNAAPQVSTPVRQEATAPAWLLTRLLGTTAAARRASGAVWLAEAESRVDQLADALAELRAGLDAEVRDAKLASMAEFAAGASHEINNPLAVIRGHAQLLLAQETDPARERQLAAIVRQTRRVHDLLQGTLQFARPPRPNPASVLVGDWLADVVSGYLPDADARGVSVDVTGGSGLAALASFDRGQMSQALGQLLRNAIEAAPSGGWVRLRAEQRSGAVTVSVEDSGPGPSGRDVEHLFDPFYSGRTAGRGRGLGLAIAWRLARQNGGDVRYSPTPGGPTRFVLTLPASSAVPERKSA